jgi:NIMA (never in mitosis gene a)-related kinase
MIKSHDFASTYVGTPFYMSPEICAAEKYTLKSDIWSLGCIIYELCAREPPFNAKTHYQLVQKIKEGKVAPLPDVYSAELNQVIKDCLKVNPDRRPDTTQLLNLPVVRLMRKEKEVVDLNKSIRAREESLRKKEKELSEALANVNRDKEAMRHEIDSQLRREWEVKARLEIDRLTNAEIEHLQKRFEEEVQARVQAELQKKTVTFKIEEERATTPQDDFSSSSKSDYPQSSIGASGDEFPSTTDITEYSTLDSPDTSRELKKPNTRTPFGRAQTMYAGQAGTPMDIEMMSPSPAAIASLSLSPRRGGGTKAPSANTGNIFAAANARDQDARWDLPRDIGLIDSDDEDICPSPTRNIKSSRNPFTSKTRPVLTSQKSCPLNRLKTKNSSGGLISKQTGQTATPAGAPSSTSPSRRISKIPSAAALQGDGSGLSSSPILGRKPSVKNVAAGSDSDSSSALGKVAAKNNLKGRTLVELQQARAGGRPLSAVIGAPASGAGENNGSPKRAFRDRIAGERRLSVESVAVWDPEKDEMPSPFLQRGRRAIIKSDS